MFYFNPFAIISTKRGWSTSMIISALGAFPPMPNQSTTVKPRDCPPDNSIDRWRISFLLMMEGSRAVAIAKPSGANIISVLKCSLRNARVVALVFLKNSPFGVLIAKRTSMSLFVSPVAIVVSQSSTRTIGQWSKTMFAASGSK